MSAFASSPQRKISCEYHKHPLHPVILPTMSAYEQHGAAHTWREEKNKNKVQDFVICPIQLQKAATNIGRPCYRACETENDRFPSPSHANFITARE